jgi:putative YhdH/YhfP family quinone oxidoreductase
MKYKALLVRELDNGKFSREIEELDTTDLPNNNVLIKVYYSSLNYKDALSARIHKGITRKYPHTPGIDAAGIVVEDKSNTFKEGDEVIVTGYDLGMNTFGGFGQYISVPEDWVVRLPKNLSLKESMYYGTAGFTSAICLNELLKNSIEIGKTVLVTGATGGVGLTSVGMLNKVGYKVIASTGKIESIEMLKEIGAKEVISRDEVIDLTGRPLLSTKWDAAIDTVGGPTLSSVIRATSMHGIVCVLGNVSGDNLNVSIYPFLLRGVSLIGIDSASKDINLRIRLWDKIANDWKIDNLEKYIKEVNLEHLNNEIDLILKGKQKGRVILNLQ